MFNPNAKTVLYAAAFVLAAVLPQAHAATIVVQPVGVTSTDSALRRRGQAPVTGIIDGTGFTAAEAATVRNRRP